MESSELRMFQMVAREGTITKAAQQLGYVQSNVTARIQSLESEIGSPLFNRHPRGMSLTSSGKLLLTYADKIIGLLDEAKLALTDRNKPYGMLAIGSTQTCAAVRLPALLTKYYQQFPGVQLSLTTGHTADLIDRMLHYELDGAFIGGSFEHPELTSVIAFPEELVIVSTPAVTALEEAVSKPVLVFSTGCSYREILQAWLATLGPSQPPMMEFGTLEAILGGVAAGLGISLVPKTVANKYVKEGTMRTHTVPSPYRYINTEFITRKDAFNSSALRELIRLLQEPSAIEAD
ncbi:LysR family transcriptional regulator [Paenibacillus oryzisoli]|uniref:LysR family transcriptional regulator n=1 Tax=Paenibacillus oryzisoli TaxID=1850517 RepID=UPI003D2DD69C